MQQQQITNNIKNIHIFYLKKKKKIDIQCATDTAY